MSRNWYSLPSFLLSIVVSLANEIDELKVSVRSTSADTVAIAEAWEIAPEVWKIQNCELFHYLRCNSGFTLIRLAGSVSVRIFNN